MKSLKQLVLAKSIAAAFVAAGIAGTAIGATPAGPIIVGGPIIINTPNLKNGSPNDGSRCLSTPNVYTALLVGNTTFCERERSVNQALSCTDQGFTDKVIRGGPGGGGRDVCAAPNRNIGSNTPLTGLTEGIDYKFVAVGSSQVATILTNQKQLEVTAVGGTEKDVDAVAISSEIVVNHPDFGSEDRVKVTIKFSTFPRAVFF